MLSFSKINKDSRAVAIVYDKQKDRTKEVVYLTKKKRGIDYDAEDFSEKLKKYINDDQSDDEISLKSRYEFQPVPPTEFSPDYKRFVNYIVGKSGSGKSFYTSLFVEKYHLLHPNNKIFYISNNPLSNDVSYSEELKEFIQEIDLSTINGVIDFTEFKDSLFIFDDIIDVAISLDPNSIANQIIKEKATSTRQQQVELTLKDKEYLDKIVLKRGKIVKQYIIQSIYSLLKLGRKNSLSVLITDHKLFSGDISSQIISESHNITLFPYGNVSNLKLKQFLTEKVSFDKDQAEEIIKNEFYQYDFLTLLTEGIQGYITNSKLKIFLRKN